MSVQRFLGVDIGASTLKAAEFISTGNGNLTLVNFGLQPLDVNPTSDEDRSKAVTDGLKKLIAERQFKTRRAAISVSGQAVLTRFMKLPAADENKIRQMVRLEAAQNVPFPIEELVWTYQVLGGKTQTEMEVILVAIKSEIIEGMNKACEAAGLDVEIVDIAPLALYNASLYNYEMNKGCTLVVDIGARTTNLIFIQPNKVFTRSIPIAGNTISQSVVQEFEIPFVEADSLKIRQGFCGLGGAYEEPELESAAKLSKLIRNVMTRLHAEIARSINFYRQQQGGSAPRKLLLSGGASIISYTDFFFKEKMEIEVEYLNPFQNVAVEFPADEKKKEAFRQHLEEIAHSMGEVVGLGLRLATECPIEINLIPPSIQRRRQLMKKVPFFAITLAGVLLMVWSWYLYYWKVTQLLTKHLNEVTEEVQRLTEIKVQLEKAEREAGDISRKSDQLQAVVRLRYFWLEFLNDLNQRVPNMVWITQLNMQSNGKTVTFSSGPSGAAVQSGQAPIRRRSTGDPTPPPATAAGKPESNAITEFEIRGLCLNNRDSDKPYQLITEFQKQLQASPYFSSVQIVETGTPAPEDWTFAYVLKATLKTPLPY